MRPPDLRHGHPCRASVLSFARRPIHFGLMPDPPVNPIRPSYDEDASVIALVRPPEADGGDQAQRTQRPKHGDLAACACHRPPIRCRHLEGPEAVQQDVSPDPSPAAIGERLRDLAGDGALFVEILGVRDRLACGANCRQLSGKDLIAPFSSTSTVLPLPTGAMVWASMVGMNAGSATASCGAAKWDGTERTQLTPGRAESRRRAPGCAGL
jgi:hypothetical protein